MANPENPENQNIRYLAERIEFLESRIRRIENFLKEEKLVEIPGDSVTEPRGVMATGEDQSEESTIESNVMEYGLAWLSSIVYLFGIIFLMAFTRDTGYTILSSLMGFVATAGIFLLSYFLRKAFPHLVYVFTISGLILLFYATLRLHYFSSEPLIRSQVISMVLLLMVIGFQIYYAIRKRNLRGKAKFPYLAESKIFNFCQR